MYAVKTIMFYDYFTDRCDSVSGGTCGKEGCSVRPAWASGTVLVLRHSSARDDDLRPVNWTSTTHRWRGQLRLDSGPTDRG